MDKKPTYEELEQKVHELKASEKYLENIIESIPANLWYLGCDQKILSVNSRAAKTAGLPRKQVLGKTVLDLFPEDCAQTAYTLHEEIFSSGESQLGIIESIPDPETGEAIWLRTDKIIASNQDGKTEGLLIFVMDITQQKLAEDKVKTLSGLLPICASCKKIRDDKGYWKQIEGYIQEHSNAEFSHGMCPECSDKLYGSEDWYIEMKKKKGIK